MSSSSPPPHSENEEDDTTMMGDVEESFVYIDDEGNSVPAEEETSWLMAIGMRGHRPHEVSNQNADVNNGASPSSSSTTPAPQTNADDDGTTTPAAATTSAPEVQQYHEDPVTFERERQLAMDRLEAVLLSIKNTSAAAHSVATVGDQQTVSCPPDDEVNDGEGYNDEEGGMGGYTYSREATTEDDWVLERIMDRRTIKGGSKGGSDYKEFYDDFGEKKTGMMVAGRVEYLCKWKWYADPTWETREMLEDEGYFKELKAFEDAALKGVGVVASKWSDIHGERPKAITVTPSTVKYASDVGSENTHASGFGDDTVIVALAGITPGSIASLFPKNIKCISYGCCAKQTAINAFLTTYSTLNQTHRPVLLFHGTQQGNIYPIAMNGLRVPRSAMDVRSGSAYGMGIYAAPSPMTSVSFCGTGSSGLMFMCIGLVSNEDPNVLVCGDYCTVFFDSKLILPVWLLQFGQSTAPVPARRLLSPTTLLSSGSGALQHRLLAKMSPDEGKAMRKVRKANILNINMLAKKIGA